MQRKPKDGDIIEVYVRGRYKGAYLIEDEDLSGKYSGYMLLKMFDRSVRRFLIPKDEVEWVVERSRGIDRGIFVAEVRKLKELK